MKDHVFLPSPNFSLAIPSKSSLSTNSDDHLIPLLSQDNFTFDEQLTSLYMHPTDYTFRLNQKTTKIKVFSHPLLPKYCLHTNTGLTIE